MSVVAIVFFLRRARVGTAPPTSGDACSDLLRAREGCNNRNGLGRSPAHFSGGGSSARLTIATEGARGSSRHVLEWRSPARVDRRYPWLFDSVVALRRVSKVDQGRAPIASRGTGRSSGGGVGVAGAASHLIASRAPHAGGRSAWSCPIVSREVGSTKIHLDIMQANTCIIEA